MQRGRQPATALTVIGAHGIETVQRPDPPAELTKEQADEWRSIVNRMPANWFPVETHGLLVNYCRQLIRARRLAEMMEKMEEDPDFDMKDYQRLLRSEQSVANTIAALATKMRLSQQSTMDERKLKPTTKSNPWMKA